MKKLSKIRLINWHYFTNETIIIKNNVLLTGQNATGKSTILDALTFVITAGETQFNLAANEKGKRDLKGYVKCKIGDDENKYLRNGDVTGHVSLEFFDENKNTYFTVGAVIDCFGDLLPAKVVFYSNDEPLSDSSFVDESGNITSTSTFKKRNNVNCYLTKKEAKREFRSLFGNLNEDYFRLIPKALAFKPIGDVKDFIYQNLLEEKQIDVENIKDSIRSYKELELTLKMIKNKIESLTKIKEAADDIDEAQQRLDYYNYLYHILDEKVLAVKIDKQSMNIKKLSEQDSLKSIEIIKYNKEIDELTERSNQLYVLLSNDEEFIQNEYLDKQIIKTNARISELKISQKEYLTCISNTKEVIRGVNFSSKTDVFKKINDLSLNYIKEDETSNIKLYLIDLDSSMNDYNNYLHQGLGQLNVEKTNVLTKINEVTNDVKRLESSSLRYRPEVVNLRHEIQNGLKTVYGYEVSVYILAELLEIDDRKWSDTVEVYLGNQRFNLIVEPRYFDTALQIYNRVKSEKHIYNVGLVNTKKINNFNNCQPNSMASIISSENIDAKRYINMTVGNLILCDKVTDLENYSSSITNDGMLYKGFTVRSLNYNAVSKPFIGRNALVEQQNQCRELATSLSAEYNRISSTINNYSMQLEAISKIDLKRIAKDCSIYSELASAKILLDDLTNQKNNSSNLSASEIEDDYNKVRGTIKKYDELKLKLVEERGSLANQLEQANLEKERFIAVLKSTSESLEDMKAANLAIANKANAEIEECLYRSKDVLKHQEEYAKKVDIETLNLSGLIDNLSVHQLRYCQEYQAIYITGLTDLPKYLAELNKLEKSEIVSYEAKVRAARESAEILFKEDFLSKLRNYIMSAESEIKKINETLTDIKFGEDSYEFVFPKSKEFSIFYDMVTKDLSEVNEGFFSLDFEQQYNAQLDELFTALSVDEQNSNGAISKFTDYRTYMDYDIKITNNSGLSVYYSKVAKEKSGGETQVPFYVAILASFVRLYQRRATFANDSIGIVMFDEVFDKMDSKRMRSMMSFIQTLPIQIILACPPQRMEILQAYTDTTIVVLRNDKKVKVVNMVKKDDQQ